MPSATAGGANLTAYFKLDGSRNITGPTNIYNSIGTLASDVLTIRGAAGQTGDLLVLQNSTPTDLTRWLSDGRQVGVLSVAGSNVEERYAINRTVTVTGTSAQVTGGGYLQTSLASGQAALVHTGYAVNVVNAGMVDFGQGITASYLSSSASAQTRAAGFNVVSQHTGAGLLTNFYGLLMASTSTGPVTNHIGASVTAAASAAVTNLIGLDVTVTGTGSTKTRAIRATGNIELTGVFNRLDTNEYQLSFGRNTTYGTCQIRIVDAGTANRGFAIAAVSSSIIGLFTEAGVLAQINTAAVNTNLLSSTGGGPMVFLGGDGTNFSDFIAGSVTYLTMRNKVHTYVDDTTFVFGTSTGAKFGTGITQKMGWWNATPVVQSTGWSATNVTTDKVFDADTVALTELADVVGTLIDTLKTYGILGA